MAKGQLAVSCSTLTIMIQLKRTIGEIILILVYTPIADKGDRKIHVDAVCKVRKLSIVMGDCKAKIKKEELRGCIG